MARRIEGDLAARHAAVVVAREMGEEHSPHLDDGPRVEFTAVLADHRPHRFVLVVQEVKAP